MHTDSTNSDDFFDEAASSIAETDRKIILRDKPGITWGKWTSWIKSQRSMFSYENINSDEGHDLSTAAKITKTIKYGKCCCCFCATKEIEIDNPFGVFLAEKKAYPKHRSIKCLPPGKNETATENGWKLQISLEKQNIKNGWDIIKDILMLYGIKEAKVINSDVVKDAYEFGKHITIYSFLQPDLDWSGIATFIYNWLSKTKFKPGPYPSNCRSFSDFIAYRNDYNPLSETKVLKDKMSTKYAQIIKKFVQTTLTEKEIAYNPFFYLLGKPGINKLDSMIKFVKDKIMALQSEWIQYKKTDAYAQILALITNTEIEELFKEGKRFSKLYDFFDTNLLLSELSKSDGKKDILLNIEDKEQLEMLYEQLKKLNSMDKGERKLLCQEFNDPFLKQTQINKTVLIEKEPKTIPIGKEHKR